MNWLKECKCLIIRHNRWGICVVHYRLAHFLYKGWRKYIGFPYLIYYHVFFRHIVGFDVHEAADIGDYFCPWHCFGISINPNVKIWHHFTIGQNTTIGQKGAHSPVIGNNVTISSGCNVIGNIVIGDNAVVGIGSVVVKDVPENCVVAGNPAKIIRRL